MIQALAAQGPHEPLGIGILPRRARSDQNLRQTHACDPPLELRSVDRDPQGLGPGDLARSGSGGVLWRGRAGPYCSTAAEDLAPRGVTPQGATLRSNRATADSPSDACRAWRRRTATHLTARFEEAAPARRTERRGRHSLGPAFESCPGANPPESSSPVVWKQDWRGLRPPLVPWRDRQNM